MSKFKEGEIIVVTYYKDSSVVKHRQIILKGDSHE